LWWAHPQRFEPVWWLRRAAQDLQRLEGDEFWAGRMPQHGWLAYWLACCPLEREAQVRAVQEGRRAACPTPLQHTRPRAQTTIRP
jgi:hypothetical protein